MRAPRRLVSVAERLPGRRPRAVVLVYHRVGERSLDPWRLTIDPEIFAGQMETLARDWSPISLAELVEGFGRRRLPERAVAVTFDDGYADNLEVAAPILLEHGIPTTLFVAAELIDAGGPPWWDELAAVLLEPARLPKTLTLSSGNGNQWSIPPVAADEPGAAVSAQPWEAKPGTRLRAFYEVWLALRELDAPTREEATRGDRRVGGCAPPLRACSLDVGAAPGIRRSPRLRARRTHAHASRLAELLNRGGWRGDGRRRRSSP